MSSQPGSATNFSARLQAALETAKGRSLQAAAPTTDQPVSAPADDQFKQRLSAAMSQARGELAPPAAETETEIGGPVGTGDHVVKPGECMSSIAFEKGFFWETLWSDAGNSELREVRKDPYVLLPGDRVAILEKRRKDETIAPEQRHRFVRRGAPERLVVHFRVGGEPRATQAYVLDIDGTITEDVTDPNGRVDVFIPPDARRATITFPETGDTYELDLGHLHPITEVSGVQCRLGNLGFYDGSIDGKTSPELERAMDAFRRRYELESDGEFDELALAKLEEIHGS